MGGLTLANITHDAQKERRERLKQKYDDKTQLKKNPHRRCTTAEAKRGWACGSNEGKAGSWSCRTHAKFLKTRTAALLQHETRRHLCV